MTLNNLTLTEGNESGVGGALAVTVGSLTLNQVTVRDSAADEGGGIYATGGATLTINRSAIHGNTASDGGGGIRVEGATVTINNSSIFGNIASSRGGGILSTDSSDDIELNHVTVTGNTSTLPNEDVIIGSGISVNQGTVTLRNSIIYGNTHQNCQVISNSVAFAVNSDNIIGGGSSASCSANQSSANPLLSANPTGSPRYYTLQRGQPGQKTRPPASAASRPISAAGPVRKAAFATSALMKVPVIRRRHHQRQRPTNPRPRRRRRPYPPA